MILEYLLRLYNSPNAFEIVVMTAMLTLFINFVIEKVRIKSYKNNLVREMKKEGYREMQLNITKSSESLLNLDTHMYKYERVLETGDVSKILDSGKTLGEYLVKIGTASDNVYAVDIAYHAHEIFFPNLYDKVHKLNNTIDDYSKVCFDFFDHYLKLLTKLRDSSNKKLDSGEVAKLISEIKACSKKELRVESELSNFRMRMQSEAFGNIL